MYMLYHKKTQRSFLLLLRILMSIMPTHQLWKVTGGASTLLPISSGLMLDVLRLTSWPSFKHSQRRYGGFLVNRLQSRPSISSTTSLNQMKRKRLSQPGSQGQSQSMDDREASFSTYRRPLINWYPGHIAKAEKMLANTLQSVDVVIEVRDARCPKATSHPDVGQWVAGKPRIVVLTHADSVPLASKRQWQKAYNRFGAARWDGQLNKITKNAVNQNIRNRVSLMPSTSTKSNEEVEAVIFVDAKRGQGIYSISRAICRAGTFVNEKRQRMGLMNRPLRVGIMGYPNVGKSALINRILGRNRAKSENTPGVTRTLQWIRVSSEKHDSMTTAKGASVVSNRAKDFELLDSPGIIPLLKKMDQSDALLLAACNSIGSAAYDNQGVASHLMQWIQALHLMGRGAVAAPEWRNKCLQRYGFDPCVPQKIASDLGPTDNHQRPESTATQFVSGDDMLYFVAQNKCQGDLENAARKILQDFRMGRVGPIALQLAPEEAEHAGQTPVQMDHNILETDGFKNTEDNSQTGRRIVVDHEEEPNRIALDAMKKAEEKGLELPPTVLIVSEDSGDSNFGTNSVEINVYDSNSIGKGMFDGW